MLGRSSQGTCEEMVGGSHMTEHRCDSTQKETCLGSSLQTEDRTGSAKEEKKLSFLHMVHGHS